MSELIFLLVNFEKRSTYTTLTYKRDNGFPFVPIDNRDLSRFNRLCAFQTRVELRRWLEWNRDETKGRLIGKMLSSHCIIDIPLKRFYLLSFHMTGIYLSKIYLVKIFMSNSFDILNIYIFSFIKTRNIYFRFFITSLWFTNRLHISSVHFRKSWECKYINFAKKQTKNRLKLKASYPRTHNRGVSRLVCQ